MWHSACSPAIPMTPSADTTARLLIHCPDRPGIIAAVTGFLFEHGANITALDQHASDPSGGRFFLRLEFQTPALDVSGTALRRAFAETVAQRFEMNWRMHFANHGVRTAVLVSRHDHCLRELLWRWAAGELPIDLQCVISNHPDLREECERFGVDFRIIEVNGVEREQAGEQLLAALPEDVELLVLARYMQILSPAVVDQFRERIINIHHSFLPAFAGANPYQQALDRGVKIIGATAHYVTAELDQGPIIDQEIARVSHRNDVQALRLLGRDLERQTLLRAVQWHAEQRIIVDGDKTIVFS